MLTPVSSPRVRSVLETLAMEDSCEGAVSVRAKKSVWLGFVVIGFEGKGWGNKEGESGTH